MTGNACVGVRVVAAVRCAPPANKPLPAERDACFPWLRREWELAAPTVRSVVALGSYGWTAAIGTLAALGYRIPRPRPRFGHGAEVPLAAPDQPPAERPKVLLVGSYHPSQQNTFTGKLTEPMLDAVLTRAAGHAGLPAH